MTAGSDLDKFTTSPRLTMFRRLVVQFPIFRLICLISVIRPES